MKILVRKPTPEEEQEMRTKPTWGCDVSQFDWHYNTQEISLITEGEVTVTYEGGSAYITAGDYVVFPAGLSCVWNVTKPLTKHYILQ